MAYKSYGPQAIRQILPLLLLKEKMAKAALPVHLHRKFDLCVQQLLATYRNFLEIKNGDVEQAYGSTLKVVPVVDTSQFDMCGIDEIVDLLASLADKPQLFENCLDLYVNEVKERMNLKKRNKALSENAPLYIDTVCCNNGLALLSMAKSIGVDPMLIETVLHHVRTPFELYMLCLVLLGTYREYYFMKPAKNTTALILTEAITIYLRKNKPYEALKTYKEKYATFTSPEQAEFKFFNLLTPLGNYFFHILEEKGKTGKTFTIQPQAVSESISKKLENTDTFTSLQMIHAAKNSSSDFEKALLQGDLPQGIAIARGQPEESELQMIGQAVEHGSERPGMVSTLIEAFQNSVDAIRGFLKKNPQVPAEKATVAFDVRMVGEKKPKLLLEVTDQIGMQSLKTLLADFLIPNYSEKGGDSVGEMGNGSYQMYREAEAVTIKTRTLDHPSKVYFLRIEPIRDTKLTKLSI